MPRIAFLASLALHSGLLAVVCSLTMHERADTGLAENESDWSETSGTTGELFAPDSFKSDEFSEHIEQPRRQQPAGTCFVKISTTVFQTFAPPKAEGNFSTPLAPSLSALPSFAPGGTGTEPAKTRKVATKSGGLGSRNGTRGGQAYAPARYASCPPPVYPAEARKARLSGTVVLLVQIDDRGRPLSIALRQTSGHTILDTVALRAIRAWRFEPAQRDGKPVSARLEIPVRFALS